MPVRRNYHALNLVPFTGIAFLWFIGVVRDRLGEREDKFFATVSLGSGILFVAMLFIAAAVAADAVVEAGAATVSGFGRRIGAVVLHVYAMRMAAVFTISTATIGLRTGHVPRWLGMTGYAFAAVLLFAADFSRAIEFLFPLWILLFSIDTLLHPPSPTIPPTSKEDHHRHGRSSDGVATRARDRVRDPAARVATEPEDDRSTRRRRSMIADQPVTLRSRPRVAHEPPRVSGPDRLLEATRILRTAEEVQGLGPRSSLSRRAPASGSAP